MRQKGYLPLHRNQWIAGPPLCWKALYPDYHSPSSTQGWQHQCQSCWEWYSLKRPSNTVVAQSFVNSYAEVSNIFASAASTLHGVSMCNNDGCTTVSPWSRPIQLSLDDSSQGRIVAILYVSRQVCKMQKSDTQQIGTLQALPNDCATILWQWNCVQKTTSQDLKQSIKCKGCESPMLEVIRVPIHLINNSKNHVSSYWAVFLLKLSMHLLCDLPLGLFSSSSPLKTYFFILSSFISACSSTSPVFSLLHLGHLTGPASNLWLSSFMVEGGPGRKRSVHCDSPPTTAHCIHCYFSVFAIVNIYLVVGKHN